MLGALPPQGRPASLPAMMIRCTAAGFMQAPSPTGTTGGTARIKLFSDPDGYQRQWRDDPNLSAPCLFLPSVIDCMGRMRLRAARLQDRRLCPWIIALPTGCCTDARHVSRALRQGSPSPPAWGLQSLHLRARPKQPSAPPSRPAHSRAVGPGVTPPDLTLTACN